MQNKRGQELSIGTLVLIVLGIVVLVLLILGFSIGWQNLFSKIGITTGSDLSAMVAACKVAAASQSKGSYCEFKRVKLSSGTLDINCEYTEVESDLGGDKLSGSCPESVSKLYKDSSTGKGVKVPVCNSNKDEKNTEKCLCAIDVCSVGQKCDVTAVTKCSA